MASGVKPRVKVPKKAAAGDVITIKTLISHKMESGQRKDKEGNVIPRSIINRSAVSTNPFIQFEAMVPEAGEFQFTWYDDDGSVYETAKKIAIG